MPFGRKRGRRRRRGRNDAWSILKEGAAAGNPDAQRVYEQMMLAYERDKAQRKAFGGRKSFKRKKAARAAVATLVAGKCESEKAALQSARDSHRQAKEAANVARRSMRSAQDALRTCESTAMQALRAAPPAVAGMGAPWDLDPETQRQLADARARGQRIAHHGRGILDAIPPGVRPYLIGFALGYLLRGKR